MRWLKMKNGEAATKNVAKVIMTMTIKTTPGEPPEGSWWTKVPLGCVLSLSIHSCPRVRDKCLAAS